MVNMIDVDAVCWLHDCRIDRVTALSVDGREPVHGIVAVSNISSAWTSSSLFTLTVGQ